MMIAKAAATGRKRIHLNANQEKVIRDKYLRDTPSPEEWLSGVAHNIALSEMLFSQDAEKWGVFAGVRKTEHQPQQHESVFTGKMLLLHDGLHDSIERESNFAKMTANLEMAYQHSPEAKQLVDFWTEHFYNLMAAFDFLPNSPTLMNAGRELQQLSACYVLPVPDSIEGISQALHAQSLIQKSGGGTGFSFGRLRPKGDIVKKTKGVASGALSFMQIFDKMTDVVKQGGTRRGANMGILPYWHPEIKDFITMKSSAGCMENFNISVALDGKFMTAVQENGDYELINPHTGKPAGKQNAREIFDLLADSAWKTGDPGIIFLDRINNTGSNPTPGLGHIESTNPCGEQPLLPWEPCNLGSINLSHFVKGDIGKAKLDYEGLERAVAIAIRFLDNVIEINNYPLPEIERMAKGNRRIGLGIMGWAETLVRLGIPYDSEDAIKEAGELMGFINQKAMHASEQLAKERGVFPNWPDSVFNTVSPHFSGQAKTPRNCARTTIAPTGTIAIAAGLQGSGIEPFFAIAYTRYNASALDALKNGQQPNQKDIFFEVNPLFKELAAEYNYFGLKETELWQKIDKNHKSVRGIPEIPERIQELFPAAHDITIDAHLKMQGAFQGMVDNAVSKTINMPAEATVADVKRAYMLSYDLGCKGVTIYRDGCKSQQVLNLGNAQPAEKKDRARDKKPFGITSEYYQINTGYGPLHIHINYDDKGPYQVFTNIPPLGTEISGLTSLIGILLSKYLDAGGDPISVLKHLNSVKGDRPIGFGENHINSIPHAIAVALRNHLKKSGLLEQGGEQEAQEKLELWEASRTLYCPKCYSSNVSYQSGCSGPTCHDCGYSECS